MRQFPRTLALLITAAALSLPVQSANAATTAKKEPTSLSEELRTLASTFERSDLTYNKARHLVSLHVENPQKNTNVRFYCDATYDTKRQVFSHMVTLVNRWGATLLDWKNTFPLLGTTANQDTVLSLKDAPSHTNVENTYRILADKASLIQSTENYKHNKALEDAKEGVDLGCYVYDQTNVNTKGIKAGNYQVGLGQAKFADVGCEIASCYNVALALGKPEHLSETIRYAEQHLLIDIGFGHLGSNPKKLDRYLDYKGFHYKKTTNFANFKAVVSHYDNCRLIMSRWNSNIFHGLHTYYIDKCAPKEFHGYNVAYGYVAPEPAEVSLDPYNHFGPFIVGYIIW